MSLSVPEKIQVFFDQLSENFSTGEFYSAVHAAKLEFFEKSGKVSEDDAEFEMRMSNFMDWYLFDRDLPGIDLPPVRYYLRERKESHNDEELKILESFTNTLHSIFEIKKIKKDLLVLIDLFSKKKHKIVITHFTPTMTNGEIFEGRVINYQAENFLTQGICFHPTEMKKYIMSEIKKIRHRDKSHHRQFILKLADMKLKHSRFQHINPRYIYSDKPAF